MLKEFKQFALRGNVVDLAIAVIIGAAFGKVIESMVGDIFMPVIGAVTHGLDFSNYFIRLSPHIDANTLADAKKQGAVLAWGNFVTIVINFVIVAWIMFMIVKGMNSLIRTAVAEPPKPAPPSREVELLTEIRDLMKQETAVDRQTPRVTPG